MTESLPSTSSPDLQIHLSRAPDGALIIHILHPGQTQTFQIPLDQAKSLLWQVISILSSPQDPPPHPLPSSPQNMPIVQEAFWLAGPTPQGAQVALWIPGLGFCAFSFTRDSCQRLGTFLLQAGQMASDTIHPTKN